MCVYISSVVERFQEGSRFLPRQLQVSGAAGRDQPQLSSSSCSVESDHTDNRSAINSLEGGLLNEKSRYCETVYSCAPVQ